MHLVWIYFKNSVSNYTVFFKIQTIDNQIRSNAKIGYTGLITPTTCILRGFFLFLFGFSVEKVSLILNWSLLCTCKLLSIDIVRSVRLAPKSEYIHIWTYDFNAILVFIVLELVSSLFDYISSLQMCNINGQTRNFKLR